MIKVMFPRGEGGHPNMFTVLTKREKTLSRLASFFKDKAALDKDYANRVTRLVKNSGLETFETKDGPIIKAMNTIRFENDAVEKVAKHHSEAALALITAGKYLETERNVIHATLAKLHAEWQRAKKVCDRSCNKLTQAKNLRTEAWKTYMRTKQSSTATSSSSSSSSSPPSSSFSSFGFGSRSRASPFDNSRGCGKKATNSPEANEAISRFVATEREGLRSSTNATPIEQRKKKKKMDLIASQKQRYEDADELYVAAVKRARDGRISFDSICSKTLEAQETVEMRRVETIWVMVERQRDVLLALSPHVAKMSTREELRLFAEEHTVGCLPGPLPTYVPMVEEAQKFLEKDVDVLKEESYQGDHTAGSGGGEEEDDKQDGGEEEEEEEEEDGFPFLEYQQQSLEERKSGYESRVKGPKYEEKEEEDGIEKGRENTMSKKRKQSISGSYNLDETSTIVKPRTGGGRAEEISKVKRIFQTERGRNLFARILNSRRGAHDNLYSPGALRRLSQLIFICLDECRGAGDMLSVSAAQVLLVLSQEPRFWEQAIHEAYAREIERCPKAKLTHRWCTDDEQAEAAELQSKILFGILMSYQHNMRGFGVDAETTTRIIVQLCASFNMSGEQTQTLVTLAKSALPASPK
eukprot:jgi/Bigna1/69033/fgenesh1_pg.7_\